MVQVRLHHHQRPRKLHPVLCHLVLAQIQVVLQESRTEERSRENLNATLAEIDESLSEDTTGGFGQVLLHSLDELLFFGCLILVEQDFHKTLSRRLPHVCVPFFDVVENARSEIIVELRQVEKVSYF